MLQLAIGKLVDAGYLYIGMDHFALPDDELALAQARGGLHRNFMGYTTHAQSDLIGFGVSSISHIGESFSQNPRTLPEWEIALDEGTLPFWRGLSMTADDVLRGEVIQQLMCQGVVAKSRYERRFDIDFDEYFAEALERMQPLASERLVTLHEDAIRVTSRGRYLLRVIAMCFDAYLSTAAPSQPRFSKAI